MNKLTILTAAAALSCTAIGLAHADEETPRSRAEVIAELDAARSSGEQQALLGEDSGSMFLSTPAAFGGLIYAGPNVGSTAAATAADSRTPATA